ncbi:MAG: DUF5799 family protein [Haloferacaceae archaeon]
MSSWTDAIVGDRMTVDREFADRIRESEFNSQEWGLIMTATELEIEHADDPDRARIVADTENLPAIMPELENLRSGMAAMGAGEDGGGRSSGGIVDTLKGALGVGGGSDDDRRRTAERLAQEYADELQAHLESKGKWERVRRSYVE